MNKAPSDPAAAAVVPATTEERRRVFWIGVSLFSLWLAGLVTLVRTSSNPVTLNVVQLRAADSIVVAELTNADTGEFALKDLVLGEGVPDEFGVLKFGEIIRPEGNTWLMALREERAGVYSVVPVPYRGRELLLVYPGDDATIAQAREVLEIR